MRQFLVNAFVILLCFLKLLLKSFLLSVVVCRYSYSEWFYGILTFVHDMLFVVVDDDVVDVCRAMPWAW